MITHSLRSSPALVDDLLEMQPDQDAMEPEVLSWDDASNNRLLASGRGSWIHNPISAFRSIQKANADLADKICVWKTPAGPAHRLACAAPGSYAVWRFARNQDTAIKLPCSQRSEILCWTGRCLMTPSASTPPRPPCHQPPLHHHGHRRRICCRWRAHRYGPASPSRPTARVRWRRRGP